MKNRLFVLGDSFAFNYFSRTVEYRQDVIPHLKNPDVESFAKEFNYFGHWTDLMGDYYKVINYSEHGCSNEDIIHQLGLIPEYIDGDRLVIIFANPARFSWMFNNKRRAVTVGSPWQSMMKSNEESTIEQQLVLRDGLWYTTDERNIEKQFISKIPNLYKEYNPLMFSWDIKFCETIPNMIPFTPNENYSTITKESGGHYVDGHMGINGNYEMFKVISKHLGVVVNNTPLTITKNII